MGYLVKLCKNEKGKHMDIAGLSMVMSQLKSQEAVGIVVMKVAMNAGK